MWKFIFSAQLALEGCSEQPDRACSCSNPVLLTLVKKLSLKPKD